MFVVITLVARQERLQRNTRDGVETFSSPTVVHFCAALLISAVMAAPWPSLVPLGAVLALVGVYGIAYAMRVLMRMTRLTSKSPYFPGFDDWFWYSLMPLATYVAILIGAVLLVVAPRDALFVLAGGTVVFIFMGIRNAWDTVTYIAVEDLTDRSGPS
ncbi:MAG: hypothetical protein ACYDCA_06555 [Candidatus Tyrphobacter sp.]